MPPPLVYVYGDGPDRPRAGERRRARSATTVAARPTRRRRCRRRLGGGRRLARPRRGARCSTAALEADVPYVGAGRQPQAGRGGARRAASVRRRRAGARPRPGRARHRRPDAGRRSRCRSWPRSSRTGRPRHPPPARAGSACRRGRRQPRPRSAIDPVCGMTSRSVAGQPAPGPRRDHRGTSAAPAACGRSPTTRPLHVVTCRRPDRRSHPTSTALRRHGSDGRRLPGRRGPGHRAVPGGAAAASRCCSRASPASARPRRPRRWPPRWTPR